MDMGLLRSFDQFGDSLFLMAVKNRLDFLLGEESTVSEYVRLPFSD